MECKLNAWPLEVLIIKLQCIAFSGSSYSMELILASKDADLRADYND